MTVVNTGIAVAWGAEHNTYADSIRERTWQALAASPEWTAWLETNIDLEETFSVVYFEDRQDERIVKRGDTVSYYVPIAAVQAAHEMRTLPSFMAELFHTVWVKWAQKLDLPAPPAVSPEASNLSRLP